MMTAIALAALGAHIAQRPVQLIHEITPVGQAGEGVVEASVIEGLLQAETLLHLGRQLLIDGSQARARRRQRGARALQGMAQIVRSECQQPREERQQADVGGQLGCGIPAGRAAESRPAGSCPESAGWKPLGRRSLMATASASGSVLELTKIRVRALRGSTWETSKS